MQLEVGKFGVNKSKSIVNKKRMPTIRCICGTKILVVPDLKAMDIAIKNHLDEHKKAYNYSNNLDSLDQILAEQVIVAVNKMSLLNVS
jgi:hypothetical protein